MVIRQLVDKWLAIVGDNVSSHAMSVDDVCLNKSTTFSFLTSSWWNCFSLFRKVVCCCQDVRVTSKRLRSDGAHNIERPSFKWLSCHGQIGWFRRLMNKIGMKLARITPLCIVNAILYHRRPIVTHPLNSII